MRGCRWNVNYFFSFCLVEEILILLSEPSNYDIDINFQNDCNFDVDLSVSRIKLILNNLDINKAQGPDNINGTVLKHCSESLAYPLSKLFKLIMLAIFRPNGKHQTLY